MLREKQMNLTHLTGGFFDGALGQRYTKQWTHTPQYVTEIPRNKEKEVDITELDAGILKTANTVEELLVRFLVLLNDRHQLEKSNLQVEQLLKRYILAVLAVSCINEQRLDDSLSLNIQLPSVPTDGVRELLGTLDDIRDFYTCVSDPTTATPTVELFTLELK